MTMTVLWLAFTAVIAGLGPAIASPVTVYTERAAWEAASRNIINIDFEGQDGDYSTPAGLTLNNVTFSSWQHFNWCFVGICFDETIYPLQVRPSNSFGGSSALFGPQDGSGNEPKAPSSATGGTLIIDLPPGVFTVAGDLALQNSSGTQVIGVFGAGYFEPLPIDSGFIGFSARQPIRQIVLSPAYFFAMNRGPVLDNFAFGQLAGDINSVPEPATFGLCLLGLACLIRRPTSSRISRGRRPV